MGQPCLLHPQNTQARRQPAVLGRTDLAGEHGAEVVAAGGQDDAVGREVLVLHAEGDVAERVALPQGVHGVEDGLGVRVGHDVLGGGHGARHLRAQPARPHVTARPPRRQGAPSRRAAPRRPSLSLTLPAPPGSPPAPRRPGGRRPPAAPPSCFPPLRPPAPRTAAPPARDGMARPHSPPRGEAPARAPRLPPSLPSPRAARPDGVIAPRRAAALPRPWVPRGCRATGSGRRLGPGGHRPPPTPPPAPASAGHRGRPGPPARKRCRA